MLWRNALLSSSGAWKGVLQTWGEGQNKLGAISKTSNSKENKKEINAFERAVFLPE
jgi:hypothetical protein